MKPQLKTNKPYALSAGFGTPMTWFRSRITLKASNPDVGVTEALMCLETSHVHTNEDDWLYVLEGKVTFHVGGHNHLGKADAFVSFPRGIPHTFTIESAKARFLVINTPAGFERMFDLAPRTLAEAVRAFTAYGMEVVGPHPRQVNAA